MSQHGYLDIPQAEVAKYTAEVLKKAGTCRVLPRARFSITPQGAIYNGLVCSPFDMGGEATGVSARGCTNCLRNAPTVNPQASGT